MFLHEAAFFISVFILFGMVFYLCKISWIAVLFLFVFVFSSLFIYGFIFNRDKILKISFLSFFILTGFFYAFWFEGKKEKMLVLPDFREVFVFKVVVSSEPIAAEKYQAMRAQLIHPSERHRRKRSRIVAKLIKVWKITEKEFNAVPEDK